MIEAAKAIKGFSASDVEAIIRENESLKESLTAILKDSVELFNILSDLAKEEKILNSRELAELSTKANDAIKGEMDSASKIIHCNAFIRQQIAHIKKALKTRPPAITTTEQPRPQPITRIMLRAQAIAAHVQDLAKSAKGKVSFTSHDARLMLKGVEGQMPSRRDTIRAFQKAAKLCPAIDFESVPGDGREMKRLILDARDLSIPVIEDKPSRNLWQRSGWSVALPWLSPG